MITTTRGSCDAGIPSEKCEYTEIDTPMYNLRHFDNGSKYWFFNPKYFKNEKGILESYKIRVTYHPKEDRITDRWEVRLGITIWNSRKRTSYDTEELFGIADTRHDAFMKVRKQIKIMKRMALRFR